MHSRGLKHDILILFFFFKQKTAYEMRISDWSSDVCSSDLQQCTAGFFFKTRCQLLDREHDTGDRRIERGGNTGRATGEDQAAPDTRRIVTPDEVRDRRADLYGRAFAADRCAAQQRSEETTSELQSIMRI